MPQPPPWITVLVLVAGPLVILADTINMTTAMTERTTIAEAENINVTLTRMNRGTSDHEEGAMTQNPTYYLARSYTNEAGERRNVLIPVQATPATAADQSETTLSGSSTAVPTYRSGINPAPDNYSPTQIYALTQDMLMTLHNAGLISDPAPQTTIQPTQPSQSATYTADHRSTLYAISVPVTTANEQPADVYPSPEALRLTSDNIKSHAYLTAKQKSATKVANLNRPRLRVRPNKNKYTSTKLQFSLPTSPSPYTNKVRFQLEDARLPSSIALQPVTSSIASTAQTYTSTASSTGPSTASTGLSQYLEPQNAKQFYFAEEGQQVEYVSALQQSGNIQSTTQPHVSSSPIHYIDSNAITQAHSPTSSPVGPPAIRQQYINNHASEINDRNPAPHVEYVKITDIEVAPRPTQALKKPPLQNLQRPRYQYLKYGGHAYQGGQSQPIQYFPQQPTRATPNHQQYLLQAHRHKVNPRPQITFASDSGLRSAIKPQQPPPSQYALSGLKSTPEPAVEFIQSNEVTFAPEVTQPPQSSREPVETHAQYVQEINSVPAVTPSTSQQYQYSTANPNDPTPSIELEYTPGKLPPMVEEAYNILKQTDQLPQKITPDNIDGSIKTLGLILQKLQEYRRDPHTHKVPVPNKKEQYRAQKEHSSSEHDYSQARGSTPGRAGIDYPTYHKIPKTSFDCTAQRYKGFFGDPATQCQVWHYCDLNGGQASFLCPNGTIFSQVALTCDWWFNVKCATTSQLYVLNERLYKYILPFAPSFPEDYSGPGVDRYLTAKFEEQEAKNNKVRSLMDALTTASPASSSTSPQPASTESTTRAAQQ